MAKPQHPPRRTRPPRPLERRAFTRLRRAGEGVSVLDCPRLARSVWGLSSDCMSVRGIGLIAPRDNSASCHMNYARWRQSDKSCDTSSMRQPSRRVRLLTVITILAMHRRTQPSSEALVVAFSAKRLRIYVFRSNLLSMAIKLDLPPFWDRVSGGLYSAASVRLRMRLLSEAGLLPRRREPLTDRDKARFLIGLYASTAHVGAVDAARAINALDNPIHEAGPELAWARLYAKFEVALTRIIEDLRLGLIWMPHGDWELLEVSICSSRPEASIAVNTGAPDSTADDEVYRWSEGALRQRFRRGFLDTRAIPGSAVSALARIDFADDKSGDTVARHEAKNAEAPGRASALPGGQIRTQRIGHPQRVQSYCVCVFVRKLTQRRITQ